MMYNNNFVVVIKSNGKVLRENNGCVLLPFGSEYTILLKNLNSRKAVAKIAVDGVDVLDGRLIVPANSSVEVKGKIRGTKVRHGFKFIQKTEEISNYRGDRPDDGLIRVEYWFEAVKVEKPSQIIWSNDCTTTYGFYSSMPSSFKLARSSAVNDGITVQGSSTNQDFAYGYTAALETSSNVIVLYLRGSSKKGKIKKAVSVEAKFICPTCGRKSKSSAKWCYNCGTNLEV